MNNENRDAVEVFSQDEYYEDLKSLLSFDSEELTEILQSSKQVQQGSCSFLVKKETSIPMSPPATPTHAPFEPLYFTALPTCGTGVPERSDTPLVPTDFKFAAKTGRYGFHLHFEEETKPPAKSCNSTYSKQLNKLYVQREVPIPIEFRTSIDLPSCVEIRAYFAYDDARHSKETVEQCPVHVKEVTVPAHKGHLIRCINVNSTYQQCPVTGRFVCSTLYSNNDDRSIMGTYTLSCLTTCRGGINRRPISAFFSLFVNGSCQGQAKISIHSCACPGRDRRNQEAKEKEKSKTKQPAPSSSATATPSSSATATPSSSSTAPSTSCPPSKRPHSDSSDHDEKGPKIKVLRQTWTDDDDQWYNVNVRVFGKRTAQKVVDMAEALNDSSAYWRLLRGIKTSSSYKNGLLLTNKGMRNTRLPALFDSKDSNEKNFEKLKARCGVRSTVLDRCESDPTTGYTVTQRKMQLTLPLSYFEKVKEE